MRGLLFVLSGYSWTIRRSEKLFTRTFAGSHSGLRNPNPIYRTVISRVDVRTLALVVVGVWFLISIVDVANVIEKARRRARGSFTSERWRNDRKYSREGVVDKKKKTVQYNKLKKKNKGTRNATHVFFKWVFIRIEKNKKKKIVLVSRYYWWHNWPSSDRRVVVQYIL